jgi:hypothetical protein
MNFALYCGRGLLPRVEGPDWLRCVALLLPHPYMCIFLKVINNECKKIKKGDVRNVGGVTSEVLRYCSSNFVVVILISNT